MPVQAGDIDFRTVEAAVLLHADVGLASLQAMSFAEAEFHLDTSVDLLEWSRHAAARARSFAHQRAALDARAGRPDAPARRSATGSTSGTSSRPWPGPPSPSASPSRPGPSRRGRSVPHTMDAGAHLIAGCVNASLAEEFALRGRDSDAQRAREAAEKALRDALALDPGLQEARLRLGKLLLDLRRAVEAESLLAEVDERGADDRQRYLARLFLGRVADRLGRPEEAPRLYGRALEAWPDSQAARLALAHALERSSGPAAPLVLVGATLGASRRPDRAARPLVALPLRPAELTRAALERVWAQALDPMNALLAAALLAAAAPQAPPVFRAEVDVVRVEVLVTRGGAPVRGLGAADFELRDDGRVQALEPILEEESPVDAILVLDLSGSVNGPKLDALKAAGRAFLDGLREGEQAALLAFHHEVQLLEPLTADLGRGAARARAGVRPRQHGARRRRLLRPAAPRARGTPHRDRGLQRRHRQPELAPRCRRRRGRLPLDAIVYGVAVRAKGDPKVPFLGDVVRATGGQLFEAASERDLRARFLDVLGDIRARYVLSYAPGRGRPGWHALEVRLKRGKGDVLARPGYWRGAP